MIQWQRLVRARPGTEGRVVDYYQYVYETKTWVRFDAKEPEAQEVVWMWVEEL